MHGSYFPETLFLVLKFVGKKRKEAVVYRMEKHATGADFVPPSIDWFCVACVVGQVQTVDQSRSKVGWAFTFLLLSALDKTNTMSVAP